MTINQTLGTEYHNLVGVFKAHLPIAVADVNGQPGKKITVEYYGERYVIVGIDGDRTAYAYRVFSTAA